MEVTNGSHDIEQKEVKEDGNSAEFVIENEEDKDEDEENSDSTNIKEQSEEVKVEEVETKIKQDTHGTVSSELGFKFGLSNLIYTLEYWCWKT